MLAEQRMEAILAELDREQAVRGIITGMAPSNTGSVLSTAPGRPSSLSTASLPARATPRASSTIISSPVSVFTT